MKIAIVGTSDLYDDEKESVMRFIEQKCREEGIEQIITGDARGVDELVRLWTPRNRVIVEKATNKQWDGENGFKERNKRIVDQVDFVYSLTTSIKSQECYHHKINDKPHQRTGGCWTMEYARSI